MLTALEEDNNKKADQYWPDRNTKVINVGKEIKLEYVETTYQGTYLNRSVIFVYLFTLINIFQDYPNYPGRWYHQEGDPPADEEVGGLFCSKRYQDYERSSAEDKKPYCKSS